MTKYINFSKEQQQEFLTQVKENSKLSWERLAHSLNVSRSMMFNYKNGTYRLPLNNFEKFCEIGNVRKSNFKLKFFEKVKKKINEPSNLTEELSEFLGILAGDGHVNNITYEVSITGHKNNDREYMEITVLSLFKSLFDIEPKVLFQENAIRCRVYSKMLVNFLNSNFNVPIGKKKDFLRIPKQIISHKNFLIPFIRGVFDTDGSVYTHHGNDIMIEISSRYPKFRKDLMTSFKFLDFHPSEGIKNVRLYRQNEVKEFFNLIKPHNNNHLKRFEQLQNKR